jgi:hypothetical protein
MKHMFMSMKGVVLSRVLPVLQTISDMMSVTQGHTRLSEIDRLIKICKSPRWNLSRQYETHVYEYVGLCHHMYCLSVLSHVLPVLQTISDIMSATQGHIRL